MRVTERVTVGPVGLGSVGYIASTLRTLQLPLRVGLDHASCERGDSGERRPAGLCQSHVLQRLLAQHVSRLRLHTFPTLSPAATDELTCAAC